MSEAERVVERTEAPATPRRTAADSRAGGAWCSRSSAGPR